MNCGSLEIESSRNKPDPLSLHANSGVAGQVRSVNTGRRTSVAKGCQSPLTPLTIDSKLQRPKRRHPKRLGRIERGDRNVRIHQRERAIGKTEYGR